MKEIKALSKQIKDQEAEINRIEAAIKDSSQKEHMALHAVTVLSSMRQRRARDVAAAIVENRAPDTALIDRQIAEAEPISEAKRIEAEEAKTLVEVFRNRLEELQKDLELLVLKKRGIAIAELERQRGDAIDEYVEAVNAIGPIVARIKAADSLIRKVNPSPALPATLPGELIFGRIQHERLPIPWTHTDRKAPPPKGAMAYPSYEVAAIHAQYSDYLPVLASPDWMVRDALLSAVNVEIEAGAAKLRAAGVEI
ncbi:hypothetical protein BGV67_04525 [Burkholderia ubonensis]|uniref:hypothetical protein n=1 Tax=Burkholderia ubonensis TaxID=101571 RepID=UPI0008FFEF30|nr:hypothetical protein [Burkholderia ubonensis]OJA74947.1 hypothetical protein BGV67_04525 [Burkholderia ubonensis]